MFHPSWILIIRRLRTSLHHYQLSHFRESLVIHASFVFCLLSFVHCADLHKFKTSSTEFLNINVNCFCCSSVSVYANVLNVLPLSTEQRAEGTGSGCLLGQVSSAFYTVSKD